MLHELFTVQSCTRQFACEKWKPLWCDGFRDLGIGDPACDYAMAWTFFDEKSRKYFLRELDKATVDRA